MKIQQSALISAFGGINFVFELLNTKKVDQLLNDNLPVLPQQSQYGWKDLFYSLLSIYMCGGDVIEDLGKNLKPHFTKNPLLNMPSPDTVLRRMKELAIPNKSARTLRGMVEHSFNTNPMLTNLNMRLLKDLGVFNTEELTLDYDNTILFSEKEDCSMTYKRDKGYQPGVCTINESNILYIENRGGNSDAKSFQHETIERAFIALAEHTKRKPDHFRADAASYQYEVVKLLEDKVKNFYIGNRNSYVEKYYSLVNLWESITDSTGECMEIGEVRICPFKKQAGKKAKEYRLIVKRKATKSNQLDLFMGDAYEYRSILTNNLNWSAVEIAIFYNHRGNMEKQFDILKNDFGWNNLPFSHMSQNTVFLHFTSMIRNLYNFIIQHFSTKVKGLKPWYRIKKFIFRFIILPAKFVYRSRQVTLRVFGITNFVT